MQYVAFNANRRMGPHVMVDAAGVEDTELELSHWPGNQTPAPYRADTSTESVLKYLADHADEPRFDSVTCDHYDVDGLLSVWAMMHPVRARELHSDLIATAYTGDFDVYTMPRAVQSCLALIALEELEVQPRMQPSSWGVSRTTAFLFEQLLPHVYDCMTRPELFESLWASEYRAVESSRETLASGSASIEEDVDLDLACIRSGTTLHPYAVHELTQCTRILECADDHIRLSYRYESFVEYQSRPIQPRVRLEPIASRLNRLEPLAGTWYADAVDSAHPCLQFYTASGAPSRSGLAHDRIIEIVRQHLANSVDTWTPHERWRVEADILPPSLDQSASDD